jgi:uncharacterized protein YndB with AHSA1/START domain
VIYRALLDATAITEWRVPIGMSSHVHNFNAHEGGSFRISLTYDAASGIGNRRRIPTPIRALCQARAT